MLFLCISLTHNKFTYLLTLIVVDLHTKEKPGIKQAVFTRRIVAFNMTYAPLGGKNGGKPLGII